MSVEPSGDEEIWGESTDKRLPVTADTCVHTPTPAPPAYFDAFLQREPDQSAVDHIDETTNTPSPCQNVTQQSLAATTPTTKTLSGSSGSKRQPSTDLTSIPSPGLPSDKKCVEQHHAQPQERSHSSDSMRVANGSDTTSSSDSDKLNRKTEPVQFRWNMTGVGSQFSEDDQHKHVRRRRRIHEVFVTYDPEESVPLALALAEMQHQIASMTSKIDAIESELAECKSRAKSDTQHLSFQYVQMSLLVAIVIIGGVIAWKI